MSTPTRWVCGRCQRQLRPVLAASCQPRGRRAFVSLQTTAEGNQNDRGSRTEAIQKADGSLPPGQSHPDTPSAPDTASDAFLEKLFLSTGRNPPETPLRMRYSQRVLSLKQARAPQLDNAEQQRVHVKRVQEKSKPNSWARGARSTRDYFSELTSRDNEGSAVGRRSARPSPTFQTTAQDDTTKSPLSRSEPGEAVSREPSQDRGLSIVQRIRKAVKNRHFDQAQSLWEQHQDQVRKGLHGPSDVLIERYTTLFSDFLGAKFFALATSVWQAIQTQGAPPTLRQWTLVLDLARRERDRASLESVWISMHDAGVVPDNVAWIIFILGIGRESSSDLMHVLTQLEERWEKVQARADALVEKVGDEDSVRYLPSILPLNAALECVVFKTNGKFMLEILSRIDRLGISPSVDTFNVLLKRAVSIKKPEMSVDHILQEMASNNIEPDKVTLATMLDYAMRGLGDDADQATVEECVRDIFAQLDKQQLKPAPHTYTTALSVLLRSNTPNAAGARAVLNHMAEKGVEPSPHTYTVLVGHYFTQRNRAAADLLTEQALSRKIKVDDNFFNRVIAGYAAMRASSRLMDCLTEMHNSGVHPNWFALERALRALATDGHRLECDKIVQDMESGRGIGGLGIRIPPAGEPTFWATVDRLRQSGQLSPSSSSSSSLSSSSSSSSSTSSLLGDAQQ